MKVHNHNLNIHYTSPSDTWEKLMKIYTEMPGWNGFINGIPHWYTKNNDERIINASIEPSGLQFYARLPKEEWELWFEEFKKKATEVLGFEVGEPEDGYDFHIALFSD